MSSRARIKVVQCSCGCQYSYSRGLWPASAACPDCGKRSGRAFLIARKVLATRISGTTKGGTPSQQMIVVTCFDCGARHSLEIRFHGQRIKCLRCGAMFDTIRPADADMPQG
jgi:sarcosine oxidase delta subunit